MGCESDPDTVWVFYLDIFMFQRQKEEEHEDQEKHWI